MILKIRYTPNNTNRYWIYIGNIKKLEYLTTRVKDLSKDANFDAWYTRKDNAKYGEHAKFGILTVTLDNGNIESYVISETAYLLNDAGGTTERLEPWRDD